MIFRDSLKQPSAKRVSRIDHDSRQITFAQLRDVLHLTASSAAILTMSLKPAFTHTFTKPVEILDVSGPRMPALQSAAQHACLHPLGA